MKFYNYQIEHRNIARINLILYPISQIQKLTSEETQNPGKEKPAKARLRQGDSDINYVVILNILNLSNIVNYFSFLRHVISLPIER